MPDIENTMLLGGLRGDKCLHTPHVALVIRPLILKRISSFSDRRLLHRYNIMIKLASRRFSIGLWSCGLFVGTKPVGIYH